MANDVGGIAGDRLKSFVERIETMEGAKADVLNDIKEIYAELKSAGYDPKIVREIIKIRGADKDELDEKEALLQTYMAALGMLPLFEAAAE